MSHPYREQFESIGEQLRAVYRQAETGGHERDPRLEFVATATGLNESHFSEGSALLDEQPTSDLWTATMDASQIASLCARRPITVGNKLRLPAVDDRSHEDGQRYGGIQGYWVDEAGSVPSETKPKFYELNLSLKKFLAICGVTSELANDSPALSKHMPFLFGLEAAFKLDNAIINGDGSGKPLGVLHSEALITVLPQSGAAPATITSTDVIGMAARLWGPSHRTAIWLTSNDGFKQLADATFGTGNPVVTFGTGGQKYILGMPLLLCEHTQPIGSAGDIVLGDFTNGYVIAEKAGSPDALSSIHVRWSTDDQVFKFRYRVDGQPLFKSPIRPWNSSTTQSVFVTLGAR